MPIGKYNPSAKLKKPLRGNSAQIKQSEENKETQCLTIASVLPLKSKAPSNQKLTKHSLSNFSSTSSTNQIENDQVGGCNVVTLQQTEEGKFVVASRSPMEREKNPDRICLDRRGLTTFPWIIDEPKLRLISLQHNLISKIEYDQLAQMTKLVFLDLYDNQIDKFCNFDPLENLRVLLMGKNRIKKIEGLKGLHKLEVLDLHGNQIMEVSSLEKLNFLKVLNLAGNNIKSIGCNDFKGLISLKELNLRRNKIKKLFGFENTPALQKLYLSNNDIQKIEDMANVVKALQIKEISIDGNPVTLTAECVSFLVSYLPNLQILSTLQISEQIRNTAMAWRLSKEQSNSSFLDLNSQVSVNARREEVISNAKSNWEIIRSQSKYFNNNTSKLSAIKKNHLQGFSFRSTNINSFSKVKSLTHSKSNDFGSLTSINKNVESKKSFKKSNSADNVLKEDNSYHKETLQFKLPPILVPIINNLTNNQDQKNKGVISKTNFFRQNCINSSDSDVESSESHQSLKSGLRNHLIKSNIRSISMDDDINYFNRNISVKNNKILHDINSFTINSQSKLKEFLENDIKNSHRQENQVESQLKTYNQHKFDLTFKSSSLDYSKSIFGDSSSSSVSSIDKSRVRSAQQKKIVHYRSNRAATARVKHKTIANETPPAPLLPLRVREQGSDYLVEIVGNTLNIYGQGALRFIDKQWDSTKANEISLVKFNYVHFNGIATILNKLKTRFPNAEHFLFKETNIGHLGQLNAFAELQGLKSLQIEPEGNPIICKNWKMYAIFRLAHWGLQIINGTQITEENIKIANEEYSGLVDMVIRSLPEALLQPLLQRLQLEKVQKQNGNQKTAKQFLFDIDPALRNVVAKEALQWRKGHITQEDLIWRHKGKIHFSQCIDQTLDAIEKLQILEEEWPKMLQELVYNTLVEYSDMNEYMKRCLQDLEKN